MPPLDRWAEEAAAAAAAERLRARLPKRPLRRFEAGLLAERIYPGRHHGWIEPRPPGADVAFLTVANDRFFRGLEALLLSLLEIYPEFISPVYLLHDGTVVPFLQRRLSDIYGGLIFEESKPSWWQQDHGSSANQRRIGDLGYLNTHALHLRGFRRVIVLDSDLLIEGALDPLWAEGDAVRAVADCGDTAYAVISSMTGRPVINSGVLSIPGCLLNDEQEQRMEALIHKCREPFCPILDSFADQKVWNQFLMAHPLELMPINFNCNIKYLMKYLDGFVEGLSVLHFTGAKPWLAPPWTNADQTSGISKKIEYGDHLYWNRRYRKLLYRHRLNLQAKQPSLSHSSPRSLSILNAKDLLRRNLDAPVHQQEEWHLLLVDPDILSGSIIDNTLCLNDAMKNSCAKLAQNATIILWTYWEWRSISDNMDYIPGLQTRFLFIDEEFSPDLFQGLDLIDSSVIGFMPKCSHDMVSAIVHVVRKIAEDRI